MEEPGVVVPFDMGHYITEPSHGEVEGQVLFQIAASHTTQPLIFEEGRVKLSQREEVQEWFPCDGVCFAEVAPPDVDPITIHPLHVEGNQVRPHERGAVIDELVKADTASKDNRTDAALVNGSSPPSEICDEGDTFIGSSPPSEICD